jgi:ABC-2 type transport system ATP-binding protein
VSDLCSRMAIISHGRVLAEGEPSQRIANVEGKIWRRVIDKNELAMAQNNHAVISTRLVAGKTVVHVFSDERPVGFEAVNPSLEDVYFSTLRVAEAA